MEYESKLSVRLMQKKLGIPELTVEKVTESQSGYVIDAKVESNLDTCLHCDSSNVVSFGWAHEKVADIPIDGKPVALKVSRQRGKSKDCHKTFVTPTPSKDSKRQLTTRLVAYIEWQCTRHTYNNVAKEVGLARTTVRDVFSDYCERQSHQLNFKTPRWLGIEKVEIIKQGTLISNVEKQTLLNLLPESDVDTLRAYLTKNIEAEKVRVVTTSMCEVYRKVIRDLMPEAVVIANRADVLSLVDKSLERVRVATRSTLSPKERELLRYDSDLLVKRRSELSSAENEQLNTWERTFPQIHQAYELKEQFYAIWDNNDIDVAMAGYQQWLDSLTSDIASYFAPMISQIQLWHDEVFANFNHTAPNEYREMLDGFAVSSADLERGGSFLAVWAALLLNNTKTAYGLSGEVFIRAASDNKKQGDK